MSLYSFDLSIIGKRKSRLENDNCDLLKSLSSEVYGCGSRVLSPLAANTLL